MWRKDHTGKAVLIYDGGCAVCQGAVRWIGEHAGSGASDLLACQSGPRKERYPRMEEATCLEAMQLVLPDGTVLSGSEALPEVVGRLKGYRALARVFSLPGMASLSGVFYRWFARHRYEIARVFMDRDRAGSLIREKENGKEVGDS